MTSEETILNQEVNNSEETQVNETMQNASEEQATAATKGKKVDWKQVTIGAASGIAFGAGSVLFMGAVSANDDPDAPKPAIDGEQGTTSIPDTNVSVDASVPVATSVTDDMSFNEAFAAARQEVGPGGVFEWHGNVYGTYYADEWNNMSDEEKAEFASHISYGATDDNTTDNNHHTAQDDQNTTDLHNNDEQKEDDQLTAEVDDQTPEVEIIDMVSGTFENGTPATILDMEIDDVPVMAIDYNMDNTVDVLLSDTDGNGIVDEYTDVSDLGLTIDSYLEAGQESLLTAGNDLPDYIDDAATDNFMA